MGLFMFLNVLKEVVCILNESRKLSLKNKKLTFSVLVLPLLLNGLFYLFDVFAIKPEMSTHVVSSCINFTVSFITDLVSVLVIVHASALAHKNENIKIRYFPVLTLKSLKGPLITSFYIFLFTLGYSFLLFIILFPLLLFSSSFYSLAAKSGALRMLFVLLFQPCLDIVWHLSMVISILEETHGIQALGKAKKVAKGMKLKLFLLNLLFGLLFFGLSQIVMLVNLKRSFAVTFTSGLVIVSLIFVVRMFQLVTYTVAYFKRKSFHVKDVESLRDVEYMKLSSTASI